MAYVVEIVIRVDNAQGVAALNSTTNAVKQLGIEGDVSMRKLSGSTNTASQSIGSMAVRWGQASQQITGHATTSLDAVRLLSQEFGLRLPRARSHALPDAWSDQRPHQLHWALCRPCHRGGRLPRRRGYLQPRTEVHLADRRG